MANAWMLRQDGEAFPVMNHLYVMGDEDLSSEAEVASFIINSDSKDQDLAKQVLDAWMAKLIENYVNYDADESEIDRSILERLSDLPYKFPYDLSKEAFLNIHKSLNNYNDIDSLYDYIDNVDANISQLSEEIKNSVNQQFCRARFGGKYDTDAGNASLWFRISSVDYNWANTIYEFTTDNYRKLKVDSIFICRDQESDYGYYSNQPEMFYKAKDGVYYFDMPIGEYLREDHEHSPVFSQTYLGAGIFAAIRKELQKGNTMYTIKCSLAKSGIDMPRNTWNYFKKGEHNKCILSSEWFDNCLSITKNRVTNVIKSIIDYYPEIQTVDVNYKPRTDSKGELKGFELIYTLQSENEAIDHIKIGTVFNKSFDRVDSGTMFRAFRREYQDLLKFRGIQVFNY